jgi:hypothetical protein
VERNEETGCTPRLTVTLAVVRRGGEHIGREALSSETNTLLSRENGSRETDVQRDGDQEKQREQQHQDRGCKRDVDGPLQVAADWAIIRGVTRAKTSRTANSAPLRAWRGIIRARVEPAHANRTRDRLIAPPG